MRVLAFIVGLALIIAVNATIANATYGDWTCALKHCVIVKGR